MNKSGPVFDSFFNNPLTLKVPLIFIQEPPTIPRSQTQIRQRSGFRILYPTTTTSERPFSCIFIQDAFAEKVFSMAAIEIPTPNITGIRIQMREDSVPINFINVYNRVETQHLNLSILHDLIQQLANQPTHLLGDFNLHHPAWNPSDWEDSPHQDADNLVCALHQLSFSLVSPAGVPTRYQSHQRPTVIDLYWLSSSVEHFDTALCSVDDEIDTTSDHRPLHLEIKLDCGNVDPPKRWNYKKTDWNKGRQKLETLLNNIDYGELDCTQDIEELATHLTDSISNAITSCTPELKITPKSKPWWTPRCNELRDRKKELTKISRRTRAPQDLRASSIALGLYQREIRVAKATCWNSFLANIPTNEIHKVTRYVKNNSAPMPFIPPLTKNDGTHTSSPAEQAQVLFDALLKGEQTAEERNSQERTPAQHIGWDNSFPEITSQEVDRALNKLKIGKAAGPDGIPVLALKEFWAIIRAPFTELARATLQYGYFPDCFKTAVCIVIPKPHKKSYKDAESYRPIALLNHISKAIEVIVTNRLQYEMDTRKLIPERHFGCRKGTGTDDALLYVTEFIRDSWHRKEVVAALALDAQGAFNNVVHEILLDDCRRAQIPEYLVRWIGSFLRDRKVSFKFSNFSSQTFRLTQGSPQGSPISGPLYLIYNTALLRRWDTGNTLASQLAKVGYADDVIWLAAAKSADRARSALERELPGANEWSSTHRTPLDLAKTQYILFAPRSKPNRDVETPLQWDGRNINSAKVIKYLGVMLDSKLDFKEQLTVMIRRGYAAAASIGRLANTRRGISTKQFLMLFKTHVCAATDYASHIWINPYQKRKGKTAKSKCIRTLELLQNQMLRKALGAVRTTPIGMLHFESAMLSPAERIRLRLARYALRQFTKPAGNMMRQIVERSFGGPRPRHKSPMDACCEHDSEVIAAIGPLRRKLETIESHALPPWHSIDLSISIPENETTAREAHDKITKSPAPAWHIYTDGSLAEGAVALGIVAYNQVSNSWSGHSYYLGSTHRFGIYEAELVALYSAVLNVQEAIDSSQLTAPPNIHIYSDSQATLKALRSCTLHGPAQYILKSILTKLTDMKALHPDTQFNFHWIPGHKGIEGNERADRAANKGRANHGNGFVLDIELRTSCSVTRRNLHETLTAPMRVEGNTLTGLTSRTARTAKGNLSSIKTAKLLESVPRATRCLATQLRSGHFPTTKSYRYRFKLTDSAKCSTCRLDDTIPHRIFICSRHIMARIALRRKILALGIRFELGPMLRNAKSLQALYEFFKPQISHSHRLL